MTTLGPTVINTTSMSDSETVAEVPPEEIPEEGPSSRKAITLSALVLLGLFGGVIGMFVAMSGKPSEALADASVDASASPWLVPATADAGAPTVTLRREPAAPENLVEEAPSPADGRILKGEVKSGVPVIRNLTGLGISASDAQLLINALDGLFDFRRARPGHKFEIRMDKATGRPVSFRYEASMTDVYIVKKQNDAFQGKKIHVPTVKKVKLFAGTIARSLYAALADLDAHPTLTGKIADVLSTQVNFYKEQRPGDTFRVMVEEESLDGHFLGYEPVLALEYNGVKSGKKRFFGFATSPGANIIYYDEKGVSVPRSAILIPLHYTRISSPFGLRFHPVLKRKKLHNGTDFAAPTGTPVWSCAAGKIICAGKRGANGNLVSIDHGEGLSSHYAHLSRFGPGIKTGVEIKQRRVIGYVGSTGRSTGPHLHWGLKKNGKFLDPLKYKIRPGRPVAHKHRAALMAIIKERSKRLDKKRIRPASEPLAKVPETHDGALGVEDDF